MAATAAASTTISAAAAVVTFTSSKAQKSTNKVVYMGGLNSYGGLKAQNIVVGLGHPIATEQCFAKVVSSLRSSNKKGRSGGGSLSSTCNAAVEIFRIAAIMNGLVLVGVAVGFVLLRIEATVEEAE
ncbi:hypothetical protein RND81_14G206600 [Saponaria officinalis]|uniref:PetM of cytochrome b6/f complex subunit 7 n=1 Tax=Saponaria officinalis TaxID=3572 RepID=A0AAW1GQE5_SAPOF